MPTPVIQLTCSQCGKVVKVKRPEKPGRYSVPCPGCKTKLGIIVKDPNQPSTDNPTAAGAGQAPQPQAPNNSMMPERRSKGDFVLNEPAQVPCAFGCGYVHQVTPTETGTNRFMCPRCKGRSSFEVRGKTIIIGPKENYQPFRGKLILIRKGWFNKEFRLSQGSNIIGRYDADPRGNSDIAISDDPSMSRRSIDISMEHNDMKGFTFRLSVLRATNPVLVNNNPLLIGEDFSLNFNDSIILGKTQFRFVKDV